MTAENQNNNSTVVVYVEPSSGMYSKMTLDQDLGKRSTTL